MTQYESPPGPGWYPDPENVGALRYWDGQSWTQHRAPDTTAPPLSYRQPRHRSRGWLIALAAAGALVIIGGCLSVLAVTLGSGPTLTCGDAAAAADDLSVYRNVDERAYAQIVKDPAGHVGEKLVIYGVVTQFDAATGTTSFLANTAAQRKRVWFNYDTNTWIIAPDKQMLADVVQDDLVTMHVEVLGATSYDTMIGGNTTAPQMCVHGIKVTGHAD
jgi:hypothetical protein